MTAVSVEHHDVSQPFVEGWEAFQAEGSEAGGAPRWVRSMQQAAIERFRQLGFPTMKNEDWHFTSVAPILEHDYLLVPTPTGDVQREDIAPFLFGEGDAWHTAVFVNGRFAPQLSSLDELPDEVQVVELARAWHEAPELVEQLGKITSYDERTFTALNTAFMYDGAVVHIGRDADVAQPIHIVYVVDANAAKTMLHPRSLIVLGRNARATVLESFVSLTDGTYFTNAVTEVALSDGATLAHIRIQREGMRAYHVGTVEAHQSRDSHFVSFSFATGAALSRTNIYTSLDGEGAGSTLNGLYMLNGEQHCDHQTMIEHAQPNCFSRELYKGILDDRSHGVFNGKVYVHPIAQKTDGKQTNNTLLLSDTAHVDTKPQLEIFADDVKCTHGATVGRLDEAALFYLKSRGINRRTARELLTYAFAADVLETIELDAVKQELEAMTLSRFTVAR